MSSMSIEEMIKNSSCFGIAYSNNVRECKICEVSLKCETKCKMGLGETPQKPAPVVMADKDEVSESDEAAKKSADKEKSASSVQKKSTTKKKPDVKYSDDMPQFKTMSIEEMEALLTERGGNPADFDKYTNTSIKKMRLTMALKKTYEVSK